MLGLDLLVVAAQREPRRSLQGAFGPVGELDRRLAGALSGDRLGHLVTCAVKGRPGRHQGPRRAVLTARKYPEQKVLRADVAVAEAPGLLLCTSDCLSRTVAESLEHLTTVGQMDSG